MKILYAIQGTGNGHISRSKEVLRHLVKKVDVDILVSESQHEINLGYKIKYKLDGLGFVFGKKGGIDYLRSIKKVRLDKFLSNIYDLPVENYDIVISDFEPIASWACKRKKKNYISLSHQTSFMSDKMPRPKKVNHLAELIIKWYAPVSIPIGLHYEKYDNFIETPIIREEIRNAKLNNNNHYTVYLPSFDEKYLLKRLNSVDVKWEFFSKHYKGSPYSNGNVKIYPVNNEWFVESLSTCEGILCNSGFETPSEALYLGKKILAIPMKGQWEQECNAEALKKLGIKILTSIEDNFEQELQDWVNSDFVYKPDYKDNIPFIVDFILESSAYNDFDNNSLNNIPPILSDGYGNSTHLEQ
ncbi:MAG: glycosyltransferase family protein [Thermodesulfobacteriota bacterium]